MTETETGRKSNSTQELPQPLRAAASVLGKVPEAMSRVPGAVSKVPGAGTVGRAADGALDKVGLVSPRGRRLAVYTGAGVLGVAGVVEWPVAVAGAAVAWLTQPRPQHRTEQRTEQGTEQGAEQHTDGNASGSAPTPKELATAHPARPSAAERAAQGMPAEPATPSDRLPSHHAAVPQRAGRGAEVE
ncbi:hypothetical protein AB0L47_17825 [Streptomyces bobili]|uniref:hypothetical protein n=1 Tax=Streptomyces bobili TaxID=67280 RepID=UPI00343EFF14